MKRTAIILSLICAAGVAFGQTYYEWESTPESLGASGGINFYSMISSGTPASDPLVLWYEYTDALTNGAGVVVDSSDAGNDGIPGAGAAEPTWYAATNGMTNAVTYDGGDSITSTVTAGQATIMYWATSGGVWRSYIKTGAAEYVNGVTQAFDETYFYDLTANVFTWGNGFTGDQTLQRVWDTAQTDFNGMHWTQAVHVGYSQWDYDNRSDWSNTVYVGTFSYDSPADTSPAGNHGTKGAGAAAPTHDGDAINGWYDFDAAGDYISCGDVAALNSVSNFTFSVWAKRDDALGGYDVLLSKETGNTTHHAQLLTPNNDPADLLCMVSDGAYAFGVTSGDVAALGVWHHFAMVFDGSGADNPARLKLYVDGVIQSLAFTGTILTKTDDFSGNNMYIGSQIAFGRNWLGLIDEVRVYGGNGAAYSLTSNQVYTLYNDTKYLFGL